MMLLLMGAMATESAFAWYRGGPRVSIGFGFGYPYYSSYPYYSPYYPPYAYYPPYYAAPTAPVYVEQQPAAPRVQPQPSGSWYYCNESGAYYPYVQECAGGWQRVAPTPPG